MEKACENDNEAVTNGLPAVQKVKMLPEVMTLLNRQNIQHAVLDPETNFLQSVKFFLEPLSNDGQLPAYNIQREIFTALTKMQIEKEALLSSGIGRIVLFYTKTKRAQPEIKRMAERLMGEWSRPILKRTDDYKKRLIDSRVVDTRYAPLFYLSLLHGPHANICSPQQCPSQTDRLPTHTRTSSLCCCCLVQGRHLVRLRPPRRASRQSPRARTHKSKPRPSGRQATVIHSRTRQQCGQLATGTPSCGCEWYGGIPKDDAKGKEAWLESMGSCSWGQGA